MGKAPCNQGIIGFLTNSNKIKGLHVISAKTLIFEGALDATEIKMAGKPAIGLELFFPVFQRIGERVAHGAVALWITFPRCLWASFGLRTFSFA